MSDLCDELRALWLPGIHKVVGHQDRGIVGLIAAQNYQIYRPATSQSVELTFSTWDDVPRAFAADCARMSNAALETIEGVSGSPAFPKSAAWLIVRAYYAGFFAAHSIMRMLGRSLTQLDGSAAGAVDAISSMFGMLPGGGLERGLYVCVADHAGRTLTLSKVTGDGPHEALWIEFTRQVKDAITHILSQRGASSPAQSAAAKLMEVQAALTGGGATLKGNWLSVIRNRVNYQQAFGTWFPYDGRQEYYDGLIERLATWRGEPDKLSIWPTRDREIQQFVETCALLVAICRELSLDMSRRCPSGKSFHEYASVSLMRRLGLPVSAPIAA